MVTKKKVPPPKTLHEQVGDLLTSHSAVCGAAWNTRVVADDVGSMNTFWRQQLSCLDTKEKVDTASIRVMLFDNISVEMWVSNFQRHVLSFAVKHTLPRF
jgi:hypothetical protein